MPHNPLQTYNDKHNPHITAPSADSENCDNEQKETENDHSNRNAIENIRQTEDALDVDAGIAGIVDRLLQVLDDTVHVAIDHWATKSHEQATSEEC